MKQILVIKLGWVLVGDVTDTAEGVLRVENTSVVRRWGTAGGLGELAMNGPTENTVLDKTGSVTVERRNVLFRIDCVQKAWKEKP